MIFSAALVFAISISMPLQADVREVFVCNYLDGKDIADVMSARDFYLKQAKKAGIEAPESFVWTPYKANVDFDLLWFSNHESMASFAAQADAGAASPEMTAVQARFETVIKCDSALGMRNVIFDGGELAVTPPAIITSNACMLNPGVTSDDLEDLWGHVRQVLSGMDEYKNGIFYSYTPVTTDQNTPDLFLYGVNDTVTDWANKRGAFAGSEAGAALGRHFQAVMDCDTSMWFGQRVVPPQE
jgi:hypothetical protein